MIIQREIIAADIRVGQYIAFTYNGKSRCCVVTKVGQYACTAWDFTVRDKLTYNGEYRNFIYNKIVGPVTAIDIVVFDDVLSQAKIPAKPHRGWLKSLINFFIPLTSKDI